jgi:hypothetical protein
VSDSFLDLVKNRVDVAPNVATTSLADFKSKKATEPSDWKTGQDRDSLKALGEGESVEIVGFLKKAKPGSGESCNCDLTKRVYTDIHLVIVAANRDKETSSITAEITPRTRLNAHPGWTYKDVKKFKGKLLRVRGWLMLDTAHLHHSVNLLGEHAHESLARVTNWEVHPVTSLEVCASTADECKAGQGWQAVQ